MDHTQTFGVGRHARSSLNRDLSRKATVLWYGIALFSGDYLSVADPHHVFEVSSNYKKCSYIVKHYMRIDGVSSPPTSKDSRQKPNIYWTGISRKLYTFTKILNKSQPFLVGHLPRQVGKRAPTAGTNGMLLHPEARPLSLRPVTAPQHYV